MPSAALLGLLLPASCAEGGAACGTNGNNYGTPYNTVESATACGCSLACSHDIKCKAWSWSAGPHIQSDGHDCTLRAEMGAMVDNCGGQCLSAAQESWSLQMTLQGEPCTVPFVYAGKTYFECTTRGHTALWCYTNTTTLAWGNCAATPAPTPRPTPAPTPMPTAATAAQIPWAVNVGGEFSPEGITSHVDGTNVIAGHFRRTVNFGDAGDQKAGAGTSSYVYTSYAAKYASDGSGAQWVATSGWKGKEVAAHADGTTVVVGIATAARENFGTAAHPLWVEMAPGSSSGIFAASYAANGTARWATLVADSTDLNDETLTGQDLSVAACPDGSTVVAGVYRGAVSFGAAGTAAGDHRSEIFVAKLSAGNGTALWVQTFNGDWDDAPKDVAAFADGSIAVGGYFEGVTTFGTAGNKQSAGAKDGFLAKLAATGAALFVAQFSSTSTLEVRGVAAMRDGSTVATGIFYGSASFGAGGILTASGNSDAFAVRVSSTGVVLWARRFGGLGADVATAVSTHSDGSSVMSGYFYQSATFGEAGILRAKGVAARDGSVSASSQRNTDCFVVKVSSAGVAAWATGFGSHGNDECHGTIMRDDGTAITVGKVHHETQIGGYTVKTGGFMTAVAFPCAAGWHSASGSRGVAPCVPCSDGRYQGMQGSNACLLCEPGSFRDASRPASDGKSACALCPAGKHQARAGIGQCDVCAAGQYQDVDAQGQKSCELALPPGELAAAALPPPCHRLAAALPSPPA
jgi:hypothetical protein